MENIGLKFSNSQKRGITALFVAVFLLSSCASGSGLGFWSFLRPAKVTYKDTKWCVPWRLKTVLKRVARRFGPVTVHSTYRRPLENKRKGGKPKSFHLTCRATDFAIKGNPSPRKVIRFLKSHWQVGGYSYYPRGFYHIDTGPRRTW